MIKILSSSGLLVYGPQSPPNGYSEKQQQQQRKSSQLQTVVAQQNAQISLKCDLQFYSNNNNNQATSINSNAPGHKVMWYLNNVFIHSSGPLEVYNFTITKKAQSGAYLALKKISQTKLDDNIASDISNDDIMIPIIASDDNDNDNTYDNEKDKNEEMTKLKSLGVISCAHHILGSTNNGGDNFHGSLMRVYQSSNQMNLKIQGKLHAFAARWRNSFAYFLLGKQISSNVYSNTSFVFSSKAYAATTFVS